MSEYNLGGAVPLDNPNYVTRPADREFYEGLQAGELCYIFNSKQMGKSSLLTRTKCRLEFEGAVCAMIDPSSSSMHMTEMQWYAGLTRELVQVLQSESKCSFSFSTWWREHDILDPVGRFEAFIETVLLREVPQKRIFIFIDETDKLLSYDFRDSFFVAVRKLYNKRANQPDYRRLLFALAGTTTPYDLIRGQNHTPFNIGRPIELTGIQLDEALPLLQGLTGKVDRPAVVLREIINWTGGQPFLTQKLCDLVTMAELPIIEETETERITQLVQEHILDNWKAQDEPVHLRFIRDRLEDASNENRAVRLYALYQQILQQGEIGFDGSPEQLELRLSGLVVNQQGKLRVFNKIYESVFNQEWVREKLDNLRDPKYAAALAVWLASGRQSGHLLQGDTLRDAQNWSVGKQLSNEDYQFLADSQRQEVQEIQAQVDNQKQKLQRRSIFASVASILFALSLAGAIVSAKSASDSRKEAETKEAEAQTAISERDGAIEERDDANQQKNSAISARDGAIEERDDANQEKKTLEKRTLELQDGLEQTQIELTKSGTQLSQTQNNLNEVQVELNTAQNVLTGTQVELSQVQESLNQTEISFNLASARQLIAQSKLILNEEPDQLARSILLAGEAIRRLISIEPI